MTDPHRSSLLLGPASLPWPASLANLLAKFCEVHHTPSREDFLKLIRRAAPRIIILYDTDERGTPNEPLLRHCALHCPGSQVIYVHPGPAMRLPSPWTLGARRVRFVMLGGTSRRQDAARIAEQVADAIAEGRPRGEE